jgi:hypothetical protein
MADAAKLGSLVERLERAVAKLEAHGEWRGRSDPASVEGPRGRGALFRARRGARAARADVAAAVSLGAFRGLRSRRRRRTQGSGWRAYGGRRRSCRGGELRGVSRLL